MPSQFDIRLVHPEDARELLNIYRPIVLNTATSFETEVPSESVFRERIKSYGEKSPWLVATIGDKVIGYAYATDHRSRQAYQWNQEVTVYVHEAYRKRGVASTLYKKLLLLLTAMGFRKAIAVITLPNEASIAFHKRFGFKHVGEMPAIGYKIGRWHDTSWWNLKLVENSEPPKEIKPLTSILHLI